MVRLALAALGILAVLALAGWLLRPDPGPGRDELDATFYAGLATGMADPTRIARQATIAALVGWDYRDRLADRAPVLAHGCDGLTSRRAAQAVLDADPSDPRRLDEDDDGRACERLPP